MVFGRRCTCLENDGESGTGYDVVQGRSNMRPFAICDLSELRTLVPHGGEGIHGEAGSTVR